MFLFNASTRRALPIACALIVSAASTGFSAASYTETFEDRLVNCTEVQTGKWSLKFSAPLVGDTSGFNAFTPVTVTVGDVTFVTELATDCKYRAGATSARLQQVVGLPGQLAMDIQLQWGNGQLSGLIRGFPPAGASPIGDNLYGGAVGPVNGTVGVSVSFGAEASASTSTPVAGTVTEKNKNSCNSSFNLRKVKLKGSAL